MDLTLRFAVDADLKIPTLPLAFDWVFHRGGDAAESFDTELGFLLLGALFLAHHEREYEAIQQLLDHRVVDFDHVSLLAQCVFQQVRNRYQNIVRGHLNARIIGLNGFVFLQNLARDDCLLE